MKTNNFISLLIIIILIINILIIRKPNEIQYVSYHSDTIRETITEYYPEPYEVKVIKTDTFLKKDTTFIFLPTERKTYSSENYHLTISGIQPQLEDITVYPKYIYQTTTIKPQPKPSFSVSVGVGYGIFNKKLDLFVGASYSVPINLPNISK